MLFVIVTQLAYPSGLSRYVDYLQSFFISSHQVVVTYLDHNGEMKVFIPNTVTKWIIPSEKREILR